MSDRGAGHHGGARDQRPPVVLVDAGVLDDGRATAGIGRYARGLLGALAEAPGLDLHVARPFRPPRSERWVTRWAHAQPAVVRAALRVRPDVAHGLAGEPVVGVALGRQVVTVHDVVPWTTPRLRRHPMREYFDLQRHRLRRCGALVADCAVVADEAAEVLGVPRSRFTVVPLGVDPVFTAEPGPADRAVLAGLGLERGTYVLWSGSLRAADPRKALDVLLAAAAATRVPGADIAAPGPSLVLAGREGAESRRLRDAAAALGVRLVLPGFVPDAELAALVRGAGAVAVPSLHEGFGLPALEAMACGAPLVVSRAGNLPDLVGDTALTVPPGDAGALSAALDELLGDAPATGARRRRAMARAEGFRWAATAAATLAVYVEVAGRRDWRRPAGYPWRP